MTSHTRKHLPAGDLQVNPYGFRWGPMNVLRVCALSDGRHVLQVMGTGKQRIEVFVSKTGRRVSFVYYPGTQNQRSEGAK